MERYQRVKMILAHAAGFVPCAAQRLVLAKLQGASAVKRVALGLDIDRAVEKELAPLRRFCYDTALSASPTALPSLLALVGADHVTFGSDWPFAPSVAVGHFTRQLDRYELSEEQRCSINRGTAETLFPRLRR
jgi:predicted TIM-barrel fold metal-dependent hydrolase